MPQNHRSHQRKREIQKTTSCVWDLRNKSREEEKGGKVPKWRRKKKKNRERSLPGSWERGSDESGEGAMDSGCISKKGKNGRTILRGANDGNFEMGKSWACEFEVGTTVANKEGRAFIVKKKLLNLLKWPNYPLDSFGAWKLAPPVFPWWPDSMVRGRISRNFACGYCFPFSS